MKPLIVVSLALGLLGACAPAAAPPIGSPTMASTLPVGNPYAPQPGDASLTRGVVFLSSTQVLIMESFPVQIAVGLEGDLPTPCHELRAAVSPASPDNEITIDVYSVVDPNLACIQVIKPFGATLPLGSFPPGHYTVRVNGQQAGEFDA